MSLMLFEHYRATVISSKAKPKLLNNLNYPPNRRAALAKALAKSVKTQRRNLDRASSR